MLTDEQVEAMQGALHDIIRNASKVVADAVELHYQLIEGSKDQLHFEQFKEVCDDADRLSGYGK